MLLTVLGYRHGHLMLFDDEEQIEVRHVISLAHHDVSVYSGGDVTPEGELWIKRNAICLSRKQDGSEAGPDGQLSKPFYLFSENCSAKEDFYFALLKNQEQTFGANASAPRPKHFEVKHIISLVQRLHSHEDNIHSRWVNALVGRVFLALYKTRDLESYISEKITKKIARVKMPSFLTNINIQRIDTGEAAPYFNNIKLKDLTVEGDCVVEADVRYTGNFRIEVAATAKIDLGQRFKAREVNLVLAVVARKVEGHVMFKIKPPPSNRVWVSFQTMPKMEMAIEPIVSSRQITYTVILRQIENRIKEVVAETLVQPFWDDIPFFKTEHKKWRGGIWEGDDAIETDGKSTEATLAQDMETYAADRAEESPDILAETRPMEKSHSMPLVDSAQSAPSSLFGRKLGKGGSAPSPSASSTSVETKAPPSAAPSPKILNHTPEPVVGTDTAHAELFKPSSSPPDHATSYMAALHSRSQDASPSVTPIGSPAKLPSLAKKPSFSSSSSADNRDGEKEKENESETTPVSAGRRNTASSADSASIRSDGQEASSPSSRSSFKDQAGSLGRNFFSRRENNGSTPSLSGDSTASSQKKNALAAVTNAAAQARQWGWNAIQRQKEMRKNSDASAQPVDISQPMGRGQPLPPPGTPLPGPTSGMTKIGPIPMPKRKPVPAPQGSDRTSDASSEETHGQAPPLPNRRRRGASHETEGDGEQGILVVAAPDDSEPETPGVEDKAEYLAPSESASITTGEATDDAASAKFTAETTQLSTPPTEPARPESPVPDKDMGKPASPSKQEKTHAEEGSPVPAAPAISSTSVANEDDDDFSGWLEDDGPDENMGQTEEGGGLSDHAAASVAQEVKS
jgi:hypothetical protein